METERDTCRPSRIRFVIPRACAGGAFRRSFSRFTLSIRASDLNWMNSETTLSGLCECFVVETYGVGAAAWLGSVLRKKSGKIVRFFYELIDFFIHMWNEFDDDMMLS